MIPHLWAKVHANSLELRLFPVREIISQKHRTFSQCGKPSRSVQDVFQMLETFSQRAGRFLGAGNLLAEVQGVFRVLETFSQCAGPFPEAGNLIAVCRAFSHLTGV